MSTRDDADAASMGFRSGDDHAEYLRNAQAAAQAPQPSQAAERDLVSMLTGYIKLIKDTGRFEEFHYIPEVQEVIDKLSGPDALQHAREHSSGRWMPIDSAPKDGVGILLSNGRTVAEGYWLYAEPYSRERRDSEGLYLGQDEFEGFDGWIDWSGGMLPEPTHWMPLPPPPTSGQQGRVQVAEASGSDEQDQGADVKEGKQ